MAEKILVVDDDPDILDGITMILESKGYQVIGVRNGLECLASLRVQRPDLIVLDLLMPKKDGFAVYKDLQEPQWTQYKDIPILILTSVREEASRRRYELETGQELRVDDYLEKPFLPDVLLQRIEKLINREAKA